MKYIVYILKSRMSGKYYIGYTQDLEDRIKRHNGGRSKYTKRRGPWDLVYTEEYDTRSLAMRRERFLKNLKSHKYIRELINIKNNN